MELCIDDTGDKAKLTITNGSKTLLRKSGTIKSLLKLVYSGTKKDNVKQSIIELQPMYKFMQKSLTKIDIKD
jgi:hypothetical protein